MKEKKPLFQIGETFGSRELIGSYVGAGLLDAQFDFNHYFDIRGTFAQDGQNIQDNILSSFRESEAYYGSHSLMGNITGNHDMARFISYASNALRFNEDPKEAGWSRDITVANPVGYLRLRMLTAYLSAIPGLPVIYYGDEIGMPGGDDPDNRRDMRFEAAWTPAEKAVFEAARAAIAARKASPALSRGTQTLLNVPERLGDDLLLFTREGGGQRVLAAWNNSTKRQTYSLKLSALGLKASAQAVTASLYAGQNAKLSVSGGYLHVSLDGKDAAAFALN